MLENRTYIKYNHVILLSFSFIGLEFGDEFWEYNESEEMYVMQRFIIIIGALIHSCLMRSYKWIGNQFIDL